MQQFPSTFGDLSGRVALVTGSSSGIGRAIATEFAKAGADIVLHYCLSRTDTEHVAEEIQSLGVAVDILQADLSEQRQRIDFCQRVMKSHPEISILVNNAGVDLLTGEQAEYSFHNKLMSLWNVDVQATLELSRILGDYFQDRQSGTIINIGWDQAERGMEGESAQLFSTAKNAIMGFTKSLAMTLAPDVRVNCIAPGWIKTAWGESASDLWQQRVLQETPLKRWGLPDDIAKLARFLASNDADYLTGQVIYANGGAER